MRQLALEYGHNINPTLSTEQLQQIADALNGGPLSHNCNVSMSNVSNQNIHKTHSISHDAVSIFVSALHGNDHSTNPTQMQFPLQTLHSALQYSRMKFGPKQPKQIVLRRGTYYLHKTIELNHLDSNLAFVSYPNESVNISGALPITNSVNNICDWQLYMNAFNDKSNDDLGIYECTVNNSNLTDIMGLRIDGYRGIRARFPNANPEIDGFGSNVIAKEWIPYSYPMDPEYKYQPLYPYRNGSNPQNAEYYTLGIGGFYCSHFDPPASWFCGNNNYQYPQAMVYNTTILPHAPYKDTSQAILQVWHPFHWASWMFEIQENMIENETFLLGKGGFQGARGGSKGGEFYIENVFEELDSPNEWFFNDSQRVLYYYTNRSGNPTNNGQSFEATNLKILFELKGNQSNPVHNISFVGLNFIDTAYTYMDKHGVPSGGDWGLQYSGAITMVGCSDITISHNTFSRLDGNAVFLFDYNRDILISYNTFEWIGDTAIAVWGNTDGIQFESENGLTAQKGPDGTKGNQPRYITVIFNFAHDVGIFEKQSSFYFQSVSCLNNISLNIFFNGPRAAIVINDGFGGNNTVSHNLAFNTCKESSDHGPFNSWDRQPYVTKVADGITKSTNEGWNEVSYNFFISNYQATYQVDTDGHSLWYKIHDNFLVYGDVAMKSNIGGFNICHFNNIYAYVNQYCINFFNSDPYPEFINKFINNTCVLNVTATDLYPQIYNYGTFYNCSNYGVYAANNTISINNGNKSNIGWCNITEETLEYRGYNVGNTVQEWIGDKQLLTMARSLVFLV